MNHNQLNIEIYQWILLFPILAIGDNEIPNNIVKRSVPTPNDYRDVYEVYGNNGFLGFAHLESNPVFPILAEEEILEDTADNDEPILVEINSEKQIHKVVNKKSNSGDDFIRLSRSDGMTPSAGKRTPKMWKLRGGKRFSSGDGKDKRKDTFIRLSRNSIDYPIAEPNKRMMWKFRAGKRGNQNIWYYFRARK